VATRGRHDVAAVGLHVDPWRDVATFYIAAWVNEEDVPATASGYAFDRAAQRAVLALEISEGPVAAVTRVNVEYD
jgi:hypothetical protein